jgi:hypothetical protein
MKSSARTLREKVRSKTRKVAGARPRAQFDRRRPSREITAAGRRASGLRAAAGRRKPARRPSTGHLFTHVSLPPRLRRLSALADGPLAGWCGAGRCLLNFSMGRCGLELGDGTLLDITGRTRSVAPFRIRGSRPAFGATPSSARITGRPLRRWTRGASPGDGLKILVDPPNGLEEPSRDEPAPQNSAAAAGRGPRPDGPRPGLWRPRRMYSVDFREVSGL